MTTEGQITGSKAASFRAPNRFSRTGTEDVGAVQTPFSALSYISEDPGTPKEKPSYHRRIYGGNFGVQLRDVARNDQGWRTHEEAKR